jgi:lambda repressor-like predicted transcriptional regulator
MTASELLKRGERRESNDRRASWPTSGSTRRLMMSEPTTMRPGPDFSVSTLLAAFLKLEKSEQEAVGAKVQAAVDPAVSDEQRRQVEDAILAVLRKAGGPASGVRPLSQDERLSAEQRALRGRMDQEETQFAERLSRLMAERQLTQAELARRMAVGQSAVSMLLSRKCRPQPRTLGKIAEALGVGVKDLWPGKVGP